MLNKQLKILTKQVIAINNTYLETKLTTTLDIEI